MNSELKDIIKEIIEKYGEAVLNEPKRVSSLLADLAQEIPKPQKTALIKSLEQGCTKILKDVPATERNICKQKLVQKLNEEEGLDLRLCEETLELLAAVLFGERQNRKVYFCINCGRELQEEWEICTLCRTSVMNHKITPAISSDSNNARHVSETIDAVIFTPSNNDKQETTGLIGYLGVFVTKIIKVLITITLITLVIIIILLSILGYFK